MRHKYGIMDICFSNYDDKATVGIASYLGSLTWKRKRALFAHALIIVLNNTWSLKGVSVCSTQ